MIVHFAKQEGKTEQMEKKEERFDCVIARKVSDGTTDILIAPFYSHLKIGDTVTARRKFERDDVLYKVVFIDEYHTLDDVLMTALFVATGVHPAKIQTKIEQKSMRWEDESNE